MSTAQLTQDQVLDAVLMDGEQPVFLYGPPIYQLSVNLPRTAAAHAIFPAASPDALDAIAVAGLGNLEFFWLPPGSPDFSRQEILETGWDQCEWLAIGDVIGSDSVDIVGVLSDKRTIQILQTTGSVLGTFTAEVPFTTEDDVLDLALLQYDGVGALDIGVMTEDGLDVYESDGNLIDHVRNFQIGDAISVIHEDWHSKDRFPWITRTSPQLLLTVEENEGVAYEGPWNLGSTWDIVRMAAGDLDLDGDDDLVLARSDGVELLRLWNLRDGQNPEGNSFQSLSTDILTLTSSASMPGSYDATPTVGDFDGDGDNDVLAPDEIDQEIEFFESTTISADAQKVNVTAMSFEFHDPPSTQATLEINLDPPTTMPAANRLDVLVWQEASLGTGMGNEAAGHHTYSVSPWPGEGDVRFTVPDLQVGSPIVYYLEFRLVSEDASGTVLQSFPTHLGAFSIDPPTIANLEVLPGAGPKLTVVQIHETPGESPTLEGGFVPQAAHTFFETADQPDY